jgi:S1-C subfamily serine protease
MRPGLLVTVALAAAVIGAASGVSALLLGREDPAATPPVTVVERVETRIVEAPIAGPGVSPAEVARQVVPSVVTVEQGFEGDDGFVGTGGGSGVVFDGDGHVITNHHVIEDAEAVRVVLSDGRIVPATVVGSDPLTDLAVIRVGIAGLPPIRIGSTAELSVGDAAYAVGNPLSLDGGPSLTGGIISAFDRRVLLQGGRELFGMLQTDAPITRGSSGGALVDGVGRLLGITTAVGVSDLGQEGLGFAIPVELVTRIVGEIIETGTVSHAFLGIVGSTRYVSDSEGTSMPSGVEIVEVVEGSAAAIAGIASGDVVVALHGIEQGTLEQLVLTLRLARVGDVVEVTILRGGERITLDVELLERPEGV